MRLLPLSNLILRTLTGLVCAIALVAAASSTMAQEGGTARYLYDANGRLKMVVLPSREAVIYEYDPAGNFTAIRRTIANVVLLSFAPHEGTAGDQVTFSGIGFGAGVEDNTVSFNGVNARIVAASPTEIVAEVPKEATTGFVTITTPNGSVTTETTGEPFTIVARVRVNPSTVTLAVGQSSQFTAIVTSLPGDRSVRWSVNGIEGGNSTVGTISAAGLYAAPGVVLRSQPIRVRATSIAVPSLLGEAEVVVRDRLLFAAFANGVSVRRGLGESVPALSPSVSIQRGLGEAVPGLSALVSVRRGLGITEPVPALNSLVSIQRGLSEPVPAISPLVSVQQGLGIREPVPGLSALLSVTTGPSILAISPNRLARGATVTVTLTGANLSGAATLSFIDTNGAIDSSIAVSNLTANAEGTELSATLTVSGSAALGRRVLIISAATGTSLTVDTGPNTIEIVTP